MQDDLISIRDFARRNNVSDKTIRDAIRVGKIVKGIKVIEGQTKIIFSIAQKEFEACIIKPKKDKKKEIKDKHVQKVIGKKIVESGSITDTEIKKTVKNDIEGKNKSESKSDDLNFNITESTTLAEAIRIEQVNKAKLSYLKVEELSGELVRKRDVYEELYQLSRDLRNSLLLIPDRLTDQLISIANDRDAFRILLYNNICNELEKVGQYLESKEDEV